MRENLHGVGSSPEETSSKKSLPPEVKVLGPIAALGVGALLCRYGLNQEVKPQEVIVSGTVNVTMFTTGKDTLEIISYDGLIPQEGMPDLPQAAYEIVGKELNGKTVIVNENVACTALVNTQKISDTDYSACLNKLIGFQTIALFENNNYKDHVELGFSRGDNGDVRAPFGSAIEMTQGPNGYVIPMGESYVSQSDLTAVILPASRVEEVEATPKFVKEGLPFATGGFIVISIIAILVRASINRALKIDKKVENKKEAAKIK